MSKHKIPKPTGRPYKAVMHFNKPGSAKGTPWTVHYRGACHIVSAIRCEVTMSSEWKPTKKDNPRAFFTAKAAELLIERDGTAVLR